MIVDDIAKRLGRLVGQPFWKANRSLNLHSLQFGEARETVTRKGERVIVGRHALHIQCAWRILQAERFIVGSRDRMTPRGNPEDVPEDFTWNEPGSTWCDEKLEALLRAHEADPLIVTSLSFGGCGAFRMELTKEYALEVFPDDSIGEQWRYFDGLAPKEEPHSVFSINADGDGEYDA